MKLLIEADDKSDGQVFDYQFINSNTEGYEALIQSLSDYSIDKLIEESGVELSQIHEVVDLLNVNNRIIVCWAMGLTQHTNSVITIQEIVNLLLHKGSIGKEGAGACPIRGHSNVQCDRTMGIYEKPSKELLENLEKVFGFAGIAKATLGDSGKIDWDDLVGNYDKIRDLIEKTINCGG